MGCYRVSVDRLPPPRRGTGSWCGAGIDKMQFHPGKLGLEFIALAGSSAASPPHLDPLPHKELRPRRSLHSSRDRATLCGEVGTVGGNRIFSSGPMGLSIPMGLILLVGLSVATWLGSSGSALRAACPAEALPPALRITTLATAHSGLISTFWSSESGRDLEPIVDDGPARLRRQDPAAPSSDDPPPSLEQQWEDYLLSPIRDSDRQKVLDALTDAEREDLKETLKKTPFELDAVAAQVYIQRLCEMGPRISGSRSMKVQRSALIRYFSEMGASVGSQSFDVPHPETRQKVTLVNTIVQLHPERRQRILFCCHYDTRPYADRDPVNPMAPMDGANDGASGVAFLMVMAPHLMELGPRLGIDLVFFDAEEFVYDRQRDPLFLGSTYFAEQYVRSPPDHRYKSGVLVDMIADRTLELYYEKNSLHYAGPLTKSIWNKARKMGVKEFVAKPLHQVRDDHLPLNQIAKIPTTDIIDFDYPSINSSISYWHTTEDTPDKCSPVSIAKVGVVLLEWARDYCK